ncbi:MAG: RAMP superfamily CRISPR-associated protein [Candidatus Jordarchaeales archaeon]|nr:CRISPR-associated RAMP protein [Candidatus Jordarchaeia archaeon]
MSGEVNADFDRLKIRYLVEGELVCDSLLHIGAAEATSSTLDNPVIRVKVDGRDVPYIPGSSLKGSLRAEAERIARGSGLSVCLPPVKVCEKEACVVCRLFGSKSLAAHVRISDALPLEENVSTLVKPGVAIDRVLGSVFPGHLYNVEAVSRGTRFKFRMVIENIDLEGNSEEAKLLKAILKELVDGNIQIGGKKSTGMGAVRLENMTIKKISVNDLLSGGKGVEVKVLEGA